MTLSVVFSTLMLQLAAHQGAPVDADAAPGLLSTIPFGIGLTSKATILFVVAVVACIVILMTRRRDRGNKRGFPEIYHEELDAMRKNRRSGDDAS